MDIGYNTNLEAVLLFSGFMLAMAIVTAVALLPTLVAIIKQHPDLWWILFVNIFLGGTVVGWIFAVIWASKSNWTIERAFVRLQ